MSKRVLLDTHALIWYQGDNPQLPKSVITEIRNENNTVFFSQVNLFEITIKQKIGKLPLFKASVENVYENAISDGFDFLSIQNVHIYNYGQIPLFANHRDPFDRLLIATAYAEDLIIITSDKNFNLYSALVETFW